MDHSVASGAPGETGTTQGCNPEFALLTRRETEVLLRLPDGEIDRVLARRLGISERTVRAHIANIKRKLGVRSRVEVALMADRHRKELAPSGGEPTAHPSVHADGTTGT